MTKPLCPAPFKNIRINVFATEQMTFRPCCNFDNYNAEHKNVQDYLVSNLLADAQKAMYSELPKACSTCVRQEAQGQTSLRQHLNNKFKDINGITQLETFPSNVCNLRCFMCNEDSSSSLAAERKQLGWINNYREIDNADASLDAIANLPDLGVVSFIGGEFFLAKRNVELLNAVAKRNLGVRLVTNATVILPQHIAALKQIKDTELQISIDGINDCYEFMRYPGKWADVHHNIHQLKQELPLARFNFNFVAQILNIHRMIETMDYANRLIIPIRITNLVDPTWLSWAVLTNEERDHLCNVLEEQVDENILTSQQRKTVDDFVSTLSNAVHEPALRKEFVKRMGQLVAHRNVSVDKQLNELPALMQEIKQYV
jgi:molybdenum cofactor biosynthesis enzyme MoaA